MSASTPAVVAKHLKITQDATGKTVLHSKHNTELDREDALLRAIRYRLFLGHPFAEFMEELELEALAAPQPSGVRPVVPSMREQIPAITRWLHEQGFTLRLYDVRVYPR